MLLNHICEFDIRPRGYYPGAQPVGSKYAKWGEMRTKEAALELVVSWMAAEHKKVVDQQDDDLFVEVTAGHDDTSGHADTFGHAATSSHDRPTAVSAPVMEQGRGRGRGRGRKGNGRGLVGGHVADQVAGHEVMILPLTKKSAKRHRYPSPYPSSTGTSSDSDDVGHDQAAPKANAKSRGRAKVKAKDVSEVMGVALSMATSSGHASSSVPARKRQLPELSEEEQRRREALKFMRAAKKR